MPVGASLKGEPGNDVLVNSSILGGELDGGAGNDTLWGGSRGFMVGGEGNDVLVSQGTIGYMTGGSGADQFWLAHGFGNDEITDFNPAEGDQILVTGPVSYTAVNIPATASSAAAEKIYFADGRILALDGFTSQSLGDNWLTVVDDGTPHTIFPAAIWQQGSVVGDGSVKEIGGSAGDVLVGGTEQDAEYGNGGNDTLWGGGGLDFLYGGDGNDILTPQQGSSVLIGGAGADRFVIGAGAAGETHWITDFNAAEGDRVVLSPGVAYSIQQWSGLAAVTLSSGAVIGLQGVTAANLGDWVVYG
jgi:Ca2+-binding RTX toxin-like protein